MNVITSIMAMMAMTFVWGGKSVDSLMGRNINSPKNPMTTKAIRKDIPCLRKEDRKSTRSNLERVISWASSYAFPKKTAGRAETTTSAKIV